MGSGLQRNCFMSSLASSLKSNTDRKRTLPELSSPPLYVLRISFSTLLFFLWWRFFSYFFIVQVLAWRKTMQRLTTFTRYSFRTAFVISRFVCISVWYMWLPGRWQCGHSLTRFLFRQQNALVWDSILTTSPLNSALKTIWQKGLIREYVIIKQYITIPFTVRGPAELILPKVIAKLCW